MSATGSGRPDGWLQPRIGDVEREGAAWALGEHYAAGRLTQEEYDERAGLAWEAKTHGDLAPLFGDLPQPHGRPLKAPLAPQQPPPRPRRPWNLLVLLLVALFVVGAVDEAPFLLVFLLVGLFVFMKRRRAGRRAGHRGYPGHWAHPRR